MDILHQHQGTGVFRYEMANGRMTPLLRKALRDFPMFRFDDRARDCVVNTFCVDGREDLVIASCASDKGGRRLLAIEQRQEPRKDLRATLAAFLSEKKVDDVSPQLQTRLHCEFDIQRDVAVGEWTVREPLYCALIRVRRLNDNVWPASEVAVDVAVPMIHLPERDRFGRPIGLLGEHFSPQQSEDYARLAVETLAQAERYSDLRDDEFDISEWSVFDPDTLAPALEARMCKALDPRLVAALEAEAADYAARRAADCNQEGPQP